MKVAVITARANSKGLPGKNLRQLGGLSLLARAIEAAKAAECFDRIILTTDGDEIAEEGKRFGARIVRRPAPLAADDARSVDAVIHALKSDGIERGIAVLLQPTSPLRTARQIAEAVALFQAEQAGSVVSVCRAPFHPYKCLLADDAQIYRAVRQTADLEAPRQQLPQAYLPNGAIYVNRVEDLLRQKRFFIEPLQLYLMDEQSSVDIDCEADLQTAAAYLAAV